MTSTLTLRMQDKEADICDDFTRYFRVTLATWFKGDEWLDKYIDATYDAINPYGA